MTHRFSIYSILCLLGFSFLPGFSQAQELWSLPIENELKTLKILNFHSQPQVFWLTGPNENQETSFEVPATSTLDIPLVNFQNEPWLRLRAKQKQILKVEVETLSFDKVALSSGSSNRWKVRTRIQNELILFNQAPFSQKIQISSWGLYRDSVELAAFEKKKLSLPPSANSQTLTLTGDVRFSGLLLTNSGPRSFLTDTRPTLFPSRKNFHYFRLSNRADTQSFIISLNDETLIQQARTQIENPLSFQPRILMAQVHYGHGNFNRDFSSISKAPWSWHVTESYRFAELASQECDGSPEFLEENLKSRIEGKGVICFWNYRVIEELTPEQVASGLK